MRPEDAARRARLLEQVQQQSERIEELQQQQSSLRKAAKPNPQELSHRLQALEHQFLSAQILPYTSKKELKEMTGGDAGYSNTVPNGLLQEFWDRANIIDDDIEEELPPGKERARVEQERLEQISMDLGLPTLPELELPEGSKIIDIRKVVAPDLGMDGQINWLSVNPDEEDVKVEPPTLHGKMHISNYLMMPSPYHPVGPVSRMQLDGKKLLTNLYPIDRAPISYENVFESPMSGAPTFNLPESEYKAYADFFESRRFPNMYCEGTWESDADRGAPVYSRVWRTQPPEQLAAAAVDLNSDGFADAVVVGRDKDKDGIPDILQIPKAQRVLVNACSSIFPH
jgi:hypothetical protein